MDFDRVLADLNEQLRNLDLAIESLERLQNGDGNGRRGRPSSRKGTRKTVGDTIGGKERA